MQPRFIFIEILKNRGILPGTGGQAFLPVCLYHRMQVETQGFTFVSRLLQEEVSKLNIEKTTLGLFLCYQIIKHKNGKR